ncbi:SapC family protein [Tianweitania sp. BSSL-BM11]|uniref:SapC family protein n=1 Tax=Tianweitania aestuarii TaxID=2814886 RepID=A0ABS5RW50_9HYPH|nr:SapC family protein [Tianweitania aestuarii]MBS9721296.1 SapC family protein [Tianweitania aestuarii]
MTADFHPISRERHSAKKWLAARDLGFAADRHLVPLVSAEIGHAARALPLAFVKSGNITTLVAVLGLTPGHNLMVGPNNRWLALYTPALLRSHPFRLAKTEADKFVLCVDEASGLVIDSAVGEAGSPFFDAQGEIAPETAKMMEFVSTLQQAEQPTAKAVQAIEAAGLLEPWPITTGEGAEAAQVQGLLRINEAALNALDANALHQLRQSGGLPIAYAQLISAGNLPMLSGLLMASRKAQAARMTVPEKSFLNEEDGSLKIDWNTFLKD